MPSTFTVQTAHLAHSAGQVGLGALQTDFGVVRIEVDQHLAFMDQIAIVSADADHGAGDQRRDFHHVAVHVGVIGAFAPAAEELVITPDAGSGEDHHDGQDKQHHFALARVARVLSVVRGLSCIDSGHDEYLELVVLRGWGCVGGGQGVA